jgi:hypothetical protein
MLEKKMGVVDEWGVRASASGGPVPVAGLLKRERPCPLLAFMHAPRAVRLSSAIWIGCVE